MRLMGMNYTTNDNGVKYTTLHGYDEFNSYFSNAEAGRGCLGKKAESIYVGDYDCSDLKPGMDIEILYDKAISTKNGFYQPVKKIVVNKTTS